MLRNVIPSGSTVLSVSLPELETKLPLLYSDILYNLHLRGKSHVSDHGGRIMLDVCSILPLSSPSCVLSDSSTGDPWYTLRGLSFDITLWLADAFLVRLIRALSPRKLRVNPLDRYIEHLYFGGLKNIFPLFCASLSSVLLVRREFFNYKL